MWRCVVVWAARATRCAAQAERHVGAVMPIAEGARPERSGVSRLYTLSREIYSIGIAISELCIIFYIS